MMELFIPFYSMSSEPKSHCKSGGQISTVKLFCSPLFLFFFCCSNLIQIWWEIGQVECDIFGFSFWGYSYVEIYQILILNGYFLR